MPRIELSVINGVSREPVSAQQSSGALEDSVINPKYQLTSRRRKLHALAFYNDQLTRTGVGNFSLSPELIDLYTKKTRRVNPFTQTVETPAAPG